MRLYYAFVTGVAGWLGLAFYDYCCPGGVGLPRRLLILLMLFLSWGINQIVNDYLGLAEDRLNAPHRPMVTGELPVRPALTLSLVLLAGVAAVTSVLNPWALVPLAVGIALNVLYEYAKAWSLLGNAIFGISIAMCTVYGFLAAGPLPTPLITSNRVAGVMMVALLNALMTYYTYFKDAAGDAAAGKQTFIVRYGIHVSRYAGVAGAFLPTAVFLVCMATGWLPWEDILYPRDFLFCAVMTVFLQLWTALRFFQQPSGKEAYFGLVTNFRACVAGQVALIAIFNGTLALYLLSASYVFIGFLFGLYGDYRS